MESLGTPLLLGCCAPLLGGTCRGLSQRLALHGALRFCKILGDWRGHEGHQPRMGFSRYIGGKLGLITDFYGLTMFFFLRVN